MSVEQVQAMFIGLALGDALGYPIDSLSIDEIRQQYGMEGLTEPPTPALYSDNAQAAMALAKALIDTDTDSLVAADFEDCASAVCAAPIGYLYDAQQLKQIASGSNRHRAAATATAYLIKLGLEAQPPTAWLGEVIAFTEEMSDELTAAMLRIGHVEGWGNRRAALEHIGQGHAGEEAVAMALYCIRQHPDDYPAAVRLAANITGKGSHVAGIVGSILGARLGMDAIPTHWQERCEDLAQLLELGIRLAHKRANQ